MDQSQAANYGVFANFIVIGDFFDDNCIGVGDFPYTNCVDVVFNWLVTTFSGGFAAFAFVVRYVLQTMAAIE